MIKYMSNCLYEAGWRTGGRKILRYIGHSYELRIIARIILWLGSIELAKVFTSMVQVGYDPDGPILRHTYLEWVKFYLGGLFPISPRITNLIIQKNTIHAGDLIPRTLKWSTSLVNLDMSKYRYIGMSCISALSGCVSLRNLNLANSHVKDISALSRCVSLRNLNLANSPVKGISALERHPTLTSLNIGGTQVKSLSPLSGCTALTLLDLSYTFVVDISPLTGCISLKCLNLYRSKVCDISALARCMSLTSLSLSYSINVDISVLAGCKSLTRLDVR